MSKTAFYFTGNNQCNTVLVVFQNEEAKFLTMVFVFLCACLLFFVTVEVTVWPIYLEILTTLV